MKFSGVFFILIIISTVLSAQTAVEPSIGDGSADNPYEIATLENLYWIAASDDVVEVPNQSERFASHYIQTADIDASDTEIWFGGQGWSMIGIDERNAFTGSYNGEDFTIDGLYINRPDSINIGFFGYTEGAIIENLGLTNVNITGGSNVGSLIGSSNDSSSISNCYSTGVLSGMLLEGAVGGLVGVNTNSTIDNCYSTADVNGFFCVGGLVGYDFSSSISNSYSSGVITGTIGSWSVGGLVG